MSYTEFCVSEKEATVMKMIESGIKQKDIAAQVGIHPRTVRKISTRVKKRATIQGYNPDYSMDKKIPMEYLLKGTSTLYGKDGEKKLEWVKTHIKAEEIQEIVKQMVEGMKEDIPSNPLNVLAYPSVRDSNLTNLHVLADYHLGMFTWGELTGTSDWNTEKAERFIVEWFKHSIEKAPDAEEGILLNLGDFFTSDSTDPVTPASKHLLDVDTKFQQMVRIGIRVIRQIVEMMRQKYKTVHIYSVCGNHDFSSTMWLKEFLHTFYERDSDIIVDNSADIYHAHVHGDVSLFFHHGHKRGVGNISDVFAAKFRTIYGATKFSYAHLGHLHHQAMKESNLMVVEQHRTMVEKDAHASNGGYMSGRSAYVITYHKKYGEVSRVNIGAELVEGYME